MSEPGLRGLIGTGSGLSALHPVVRLRRSPRSSARDVAQVVQATRGLVERHAQWRAGTIRFAEYDASVLGWINHVRGAYTWGLRQYVLEGLPLDGMPLR